MAGRVLRGVGRTLLALGLLVGLTSFTVGLSAGVGGLLGGVPLPLSSADAVAVDSTGRVYVTTPPLQRVQVFDPDGDFERAVLVEPAAKTRLHIALDANDRLWVLQARLQRYDGSGRLDFEQALDEDSSRRRSWHLGLDGEVDPKRRETAPAVEALEPVQTGGALFPFARPQVAGASLPFRRPDGTTCTARPGFWSASVECQSPTRRWTLASPAWLSPFGFPAPGIPLAVLLAGAGLVMVRLARPRPRTATARSPR